jgi:hypothetical protein
MKTLLSLTILAALACPVYGVDGVVLINQSSALAGNVTPGDTPGFPVTISVSGSYRLSSNLIVPDPSTTAIVITADSVSIDLNGFSIIGPAVCPGTSCFALVEVPAIVSSNAGISVSNGTVRGVGTGISLRGPHSRVVNVAAFGNVFDGIQVSSGIVSSCTASSNGFYGIHTGCPSLIVMNAAFGNPSANIVTSGSGCVLVNNDAP